MPTKRAILAELTRDELRTNLDYFELEVEDRRVKTQLVDALSRSRQAPLDKILQDLSRDRLKELCRAFDLDDSGRKKADLAARLMGRTAASKAADAGAAMPPAVSASVTDKLSVAQLEQSLWVRGGHPPRVHRQQRLQDLYLRPALPETAVRSVRGGGGEAHC